MHTNIKVLGNIGPATEAELACIQGRNSPDLTTSTRSLVVEHPEEHCPASIVNRLTHSRLVALRHPFDVQILNGDQTVSINQEAGELVQKVLTLPSNLSMQACQDAASPTTGVQRVASLGFGQSLLALAVETWGFDLGSVRQGNEVVKAHIQTYSGASMRGGSWCRHFESKGGEPLTVSRTGEHHILNHSIFRDSPMPTDAKFTDILNPQASLGRQANTVSEAKLQGSETLSRLKARSSPYALEESPIVFIQTAKNLLTGREVQQGKFSIFLTQQLEIGSLVGVADRAANIASSRASDVPRQRYRVYNRCSAARQASAAVPWSDISCTGKRGASNLLSVQAYHTKKGESRALHPVP